MRSWHHGEVTAADPFDPMCPCSSGRALRACCSPIGSGEFDDAAVHAVLTALRAFGARDEFAAAMRRNGAALVVPLPEDAQARLLACCEDDFRLMVVQMLYTVLPVRGDASLAAMLLRRGAPGLTPNARALLAQMAAFPPSLYEVCEVTPGQSLRLRDRMRSGDVLIAERSTSWQARPGHLVLARVRTRADGTPVFEPPVLPLLDRESVERLLAAHGAERAMRVDAQHRLLLGLCLLWQATAAAASADEVW